MSWPAQPKPRHPANSPVSFYRLLLGRILAKDSRGGCEGKVPAWPSPQTAPRPVLSRRATESIPKSGNRNATARLTQPASRWNCEFLLLWKGLGTFLEIRSLEFAFGNKEVQIFRSVFPSEA